MPVNLFIIAIRTTLTSNIVLGKKLFLESMMQGTMEDYFNLAEQYTT